MSNKNVVSLLGADRRIVSNDQEFVSCMHAVPKKFLGIRFHRVGARLMLPSGEYLPVDEMPAVEAWEYLTQIVALAIDNSQTSEECENIVGSLGPLYEEDPDAINLLLSEIDPQIGMNLLLEENPSFDLNDPPREIVAQVVNVLMSLRPTPAAEDEETRQLKQFQADQDRPT